MTRNVRSAWHGRARFTALLLALATTTVALEDISFGTGRPVSEDGMIVDGGPMPGGSASKAKLVRLVKTPAGAHDGRLVTVFADANTEGLVWHPRGGLHAARDIFTRYSDDEGATWSDPVNLSNSAGSYSAVTDSDGDGVAEAYWGDSGKSTIFNSGDTVVVTWTDKYAPEPDWVWGASGVSSLQGEVSYADIDVYPNVHVVPYSCMMLAVSTDGGASWTYGGDNPPLQLTYGRRDALQDVHRGSGSRWVVTWQEDPEGLQPGEAEGPGEGSSGAKTTKGTDIWYAWTADIVNDAAALRANRTPLSNHSAYDVTATDGYPIAGKAGAAENHGASRANLFLVKDGPTFLSLVAYEETKGVPDVLEGKTVQYHAFPFDQPLVDGEETRRIGSAGVQLTDLLANSRRVRFVVQPPDGVVPALAIFWKQGVETEGGPSDIMLKTSLALDEASVLAAPAVNVSTRTPSATMDDMLLGTEVDPIEDARAHRAYLRGNQLVVGYSYTWNGPLARYTDLANYEFWIRRSLDGGVTWTAPQNLSNLPDTTINVLEPRLVGPSKTGTQDDASFIVAWGTETNVYEGVEVPHPLDVFVTRTVDQGASFEPPVAVTDTADSEFESQFRIDDDAGRIYAVWMSTDGTRTDARFGISSPWQDLGHALAGTAGEPRLVGDGPLTAGSQNSFVLTGAAPDAPMMLFLGFELAHAPFKGGTLLPVPPFFAVGLMSSADGGAVVELGWPASAPADLRMIVQLAIADTAAPVGVALSNGVAGTSR